MISALSMENETKREISTWEAMEFVWEVLIAIAVPTTLFALGGRWLDTKWGTTPWMTVLGLVLALAIAALLVLRKGKKMAQRMK